MRAAFALALLAAAPVAAETRVSSLFHHNWATQQQLIIDTQRAKIPRMSKLLRMLDVKPGMIVVDMGMGTGQAAYLLARAVGPTGRVYGTDVEPSLVGYVEAQARLLKLANLKAVLVRAGGVDPFYRSQRWDLALLYDVVALLHRRVDYYRALRENLAPGGRVAIVSQPTIPYELTRQDFADWDGFIADLKREPPGSPYGRELAAPVMAALADGSAGGLGIDRVVELHLNDALYGPLFSRVSTGTAFAPEVQFTPEERPYADWLLTRMNLIGYPREKNFLELINLEVHAVAMLNKLVLIQRYRRYLRHDGQEPYYSETPETHWRLDHDLNRSELAEAGFARVTRVDFAPFQSVWIAQAP